MNFSDFKRAINIYADDDRAQVYIEQELADNVFLQTPVLYVRKEINNNGVTTYIITGTTGDQV